MRVISGERRGKKLYTLEGTNTRPTLDRVKEALFNIIQNKILDANVLDLFAGSGSLGIETLSRGARHVVFCDHSFEAIKVIKKNIEETKYIEKSTIINKDYKLALKQISKTDGKFDIVFLDPPYKSDFGIKAIDELIKLDLIAEDWIIILETADENRKKEIEENKQIKIFDERKYGSVKLIFIRKE